MNTEIIVRIAEKKNKKKKSLTGHSVANGNST